MRPIRQCPHLRINNIVFRILLYISASWLITAQSRIDGRITDETTGKPLIGVNIFFSKTSLGTTTDMDGFYTMKNIPEGRYELVISMIGFKMERENLIFFKHDRITIDFRLTPEPIQMKEITVTQKTDKEWVKNYRLFKQAFLGTTRNGESCRILNEYVISFDRKQGLLTATASQPLQIENKRLGYEITYYLKEFKLDDTSVRYAGDSYFKEMEPISNRESIKWIKNRNETYNGSVRHFLFTLSERFDLRYEMKGDSAVENSAWGKMSGQHKYDPLMVEGFEIYVLKSRRSGNRDDDYRLINPNARIVFPGDHPNELRLSFKQNIMVLYRRESEDDNYSKNLSAFGSRPVQTSYLLLKKDTVVFDKSGRYFETYMIEQRGYMGWERFGDKLPFDYTLPD